MTPSSLEHDAYEFWPKPKVVVGAAKRFTAATGAHCGGN